MEEAIYEVLDVTNPETYFTLGVFKTLSEATIKVNEIYPDGGLFDNSDYYEDVRVVEIRRRLIGVWSGHGQCVARVRWEKLGDDEEWDRNFELL